MTKPPMARDIAETLTVPERVMLFCLAPKTDWLKAGVRHGVAQTLLVRGLIDREQAGSYRLTDEGRAVWEALLSNPAP